MKEAKVNLNRTKDKIKREAINQKLIKLRPMRDSIFASIYAEDDEKSVKAGLMNTDVNYLHKAGVPTNSRIRPKSASGVLERRCVEQTNIDQQHNVKDAVLRTSFAPIKQEITEISTNVAKIGISSIIKQQHKQHLNPSKDCERNGIYSTNVNDHRDRSATSTGGGSITKDSAIVSMKWDSSAPHHNRSVATSFINNATTTTCIIKADNDTTTTITRMTVMAMAESSRRIAARSTTTVIPSSPSSSAAFSPSVVQDDIKLTKVLQQRAAIQLSRENDLMEKLQQRQAATQIKTDQVIEKERQRAWLIKVVFLSRMRYN